MALAADWGGGGEVYEGQDLEALNDLPGYYGWILETFAPYLGGRVLEVGAGTGNFAAHYVDAVREATLLEPAPNLYRSLAERFSGKAHVAPIRGLLEDWCDGRRGPRSLRDGCFDAAVMVNVLEHIEDDRGTVARLGRLLRPEGTLLLFVPALPWLYGSLDALVHHYRRYSSWGLERTVREAGLEVVHLRYFDVLGVVPWFVTGRIFRRRKFDPGAARVYDRIVIPLARRLERWLRVPLGKNLICVARRPSRGAAFAKAA